MNSPVLSPLYVLFVLTLCVLLAEYLGSLKQLRRFGPAFLVIIITAVVANAGIIPTKDHVIYDGIFSYVAPASIFLLLLEVNLRELRNVGMPMLVLFLAGSLGTTAGVLVATQVIPDEPVFNGFYAPLAGMIAGTYTGGALNFNAVALHYGVMEEGILFAGAIAVDNIITVVWMFCTLLIPFVFGGTRKAKAVKITEEKEKSERSISIIELSVLICITVFALWFSESLADLLANSGFEIPSIIIVTTLALLLAQHPFISSMKFAHKIGAWLIYLFLGVVGAYCDIAAMGEAGQLALLLLGFILITIFVHILVVIVVARIFKWDWDLVAITSQANIGGATTAMALAESFKRNELVLPAIVIGALGNALGTYIGFIVAGLV